MPRLRLKVHLLVSASPRSTASERLNLAIRPPKRSLQCCSISSSPTLANLESPVQTSNTLGLEYAPLSKPSSFNSGKRPIRTVTLTFLGLLLPGPLLSQGVQATVTFADAHVLTGRARFHSQYHTGTEGPRDLGPSDSLIFLAEGSDAPARIPTSAITSLKLTYIEKQNDRDPEVFTITRQATLLLASGDSLRGTLPGSAQLPPRSPYTIGLDIETAPFVIKRLNLQEFVSPYFPRLLEAERVVSVRFHHRAPRSTSRP